MPGRRERGTRAQEEVAQIGQSCEGPSAVEWETEGGRRLLAKSSAFLVLSQRLPECLSLTAAAEQGQSGLEGSRGCFWEVRHQWGLSWEWAYAAHPVLLVPVSLWQSSLCSRDRQGSIETRVYSCVCFLKPVG